MSMERWYRSQLAPNMEMHSISYFRRREKVAKILTDRNAYTKMVEDKAIGAI